MLLKNLGLILGSLFLSPVISQQCVTPFSDIEISKISSQSIGFDLSKKVKTPCDSKNFFMWFDVSTASDVYFTISSKDVPDISKDFIGVIGAKSGIWFLGQGDTYPVFNSEISNSTSVKVGILINEGGISLFKDLKKTNHITSNDQKYVDLVSSFGNLNVAFSSKYPKTQIKNINVMCINDVICNTDTQPQETQELSVCENFSTVENMAYSSYQKDVQYYIDRPIIIPCDTKNFNISFNAAVASDLFIAFSGREGVYGSLGAIEAHLDFDSQNATIKKVSDFSSRPQYVSSDFINVSVNVVYSQGTLLITSNSTSVAEYTVSEYDITQLYIAPAVGASIIHEFVINCESISKCGPQCTFTNSLPNTSYSPEDLSKTLNQDDFTYSNCLGSDFEFSASISSNSDFYIRAFTKDLKVNVPLKTLRFGSVSGIFGYYNGYLVLDDKLIDQQTSIQYKNSSISLKYVNKNLYFYYNNELMNTSSCENLDLLALGFYTINGTTALSNRVFTCLNQIEGCSN
ncbi:hypothetical protein AYI69_g3644 [Smittium culicis]|uniref:Uncharacterized protein n=1 Tax=Smittium culicis TaxID=133412 RepID=A0A1R1YJ39_9FUNG|nr:hypothetical protein AYI69_g3644 [Smittium culicis]